VALPETVEAKKLPPAEPAKIVTPVAPKPPEKKPEDVPKEVPKPAKEKPIQTAVVAKKKSPDPAAPKRPKSPEKPVEKPVETPVPQASISKPSSYKPEVPSSEEPLPSSSSVRVDVNSPIRVFPDIPIPKTHETPFVKRSQVVDFLKAYTSAYQKGNAKIFFSFFTDNALENGKRLKDIKPDYLKIWGKVQHLGYHIAVDETNQIVGSELVSMKGRFDLDWKFKDGQNGQSHGEISMDFKVNDDVLRVSRLDYRFDE